MLTQYLKITKNKIVFMSLSLLVATMAMFLYACETEPNKKDNNNDGDGGNGGDLTCQDGEELKDGECVPLNDGGDLECQDGEELKDGACVPSAVFSVGDFDFTISLDKPVGNDPKNEHLVEASISAPDNDPSDGIDITIHAEVGSGAAAPYSFTPSITITTEVADYTIQKKVGEELSLLDLDDLQEQDYSNLVTYVISAENFSVEYNVTVKLIPKITAFHFFKIDNPHILDDIDDDTNLDVDATISDDTATLYFASSSQAENPRAFAPSFTVSGGVNAVNGEPLPIKHFNHDGLYTATEAIDFTNPVEYTFTTGQGANAFSQTYTVSISLAGRLESFGFAKADNPDLISENDIVVDLSQETATPSLKTEGLDSSVLTPSIIASEGATLTPEGSQDFSNLVTYTVTGQGGNTRSYNVQPSFERTLKYITTIDDTQGMGLHLLDGASSVTTAVVDGNTYVFAAGDEDNGVTVFKVDKQDEEITLSYIDNEQSGSKGSNSIIPGLYNAKSLATHTIGSSTYLLVGGEGNTEGLSGLDMYAVSAEGKLSRVGNPLRGDDIRESLYSLNSITTMDLTTTNSAKKLSYVLVTTKKGMVIYQISETGINPTVVADALSSENNRNLLGGARAVSTAVVDGTLYVYLATSGTDWGAITTHTATVAEDLNEDGSEKEEPTFSFTLARKGQVTQASTGYEKIKATTTIKTASIVEGGAEKQYLFVAATDSGKTITAFEIATTGTLTRTSAIILGEQVYDGAFHSSLEHALIGGTNYLFASSTSKANAIDDNSSTLSVLTISNGVLTAATAVVDGQDSEITSLRGLRSIATAEIDGSRYIFAAANYDDAISIFR